LLSLIRQGMEGPQMPYFRYAGSWRYPIAGGRCPYCHKPVTMTRYGCPNCRMPLQLTKYGYVPIHLINKEPVANK
jgi:predicted amidophosphoribosyltransferase